MFNTTYVPKQQRVLRPSTFQRVEERGVGVFCGGSVAGERESLAGEHAKEGGREKREDAPINENKIHSYLCSSPTYKKESFNSLSNGTRKEFILNIEKPNNSKD